MRIQRAATALLIAVAVVLGANLVTATGRFIDAYSAYDALDIRLESFEFTDTSQPVHIVLSFANPTGQTLDLTALEVRIAAGVHTVGGGTARMENSLEPGESTSVTVDASINDPRYVDALAGQQIEWILNGRVLAQAGHGLEPTWIPFATRTFTP